MTDNTTFETQADWLNGRVVRADPPTEGSKDGKASDPIDRLVREITARGNDVEVRTCREGIKVIEVTKRVAGVFPAKE